MHVWVCSPSKITAAALAELVGELGFTASTSKEETSEVALWDLSSGPFPRPPALPTLVLLQGGERRGAYLLERGFYGYLDNQAGKEVLERALQAIYQGRTWVGNRPGSTAQRGGEGERC